MKKNSFDINFYSGTNKSLESLFFVFLLLIIIFFFILFLRLFQLSIVKGGYYQRISEQNRIREVNIEAPRGKIIDRKGFVVAYNTPLPDLAKNNEKVTSKRIYQSPEAIAHLIGYRQVADKTDLNNDNCLEKLKLGDKVGKKGVEKIFDCLLRGKSGKKIIEVDAQGRYLRTLDIIPPTTGETIQLAFDFELQKKIYDLIKDKKAAVVAIAPKSGEILALVSSPSFNPQDFEDQAGSVGGYFENKDKPLFNRVTEATYPPGSLFKLVTATAALEEKAIDEKTQIEDTGILTAGPLKFGNWYYLQYGKTEGMVDIVKAIKRSNDIFFYQAGEKTGVDKIKKWAEILGYGTDHHFGFDEATGIIPSTFWKKETLGDQWYLGDTYNFAIGQGYILVTPLQTVLVTSVFANNGYFCQPKLLKNDTPDCKRLPISQKNIDLIREGMKEACSPGGTGWPLFNFQVKDEKGNLKNIQTSCKTGTAESSAADSVQPHAWMTAYAPSENPEIAISVLIEQGGQGSDIAGPIIKEIFKAYFERKE